MNVSSYNDLGAPTPSSDDVKMSKIMRSLPTCYNEKVISILKLRTIKQVSREA